MNRVTELLSLAKEFEVTIVHAKKKEDNNINGTHLFMPGFEELEIAIYESDVEGFNTIIIHNSSTWQYSKKKDKVKVGYKLLA